MSSVFAARLTPASSDWLALGDSRYGNELRQQPTPTLPHHVHLSSLAPTSSAAATVALRTDSRSYELVTIKPDPDDMGAYTSRETLIQGDNVRVSSPGFRPADESYMSTYPGAWMSRQTPPTSESSRPDASTYQHVPVSIQYDEWSRRGASRSDLYHHHQQQQRLMRKLSTENSTDHVDKYVVTDVITAGRSGEEPTMWNAEVPDRRRSSPATSSIDAYRTADVDRQNTVSVHLDRHHGPPGDQRLDDEQYRPRALFSRSYRQQMAPVDVEDERRRPVEQPHRWVKASSAYDGSPPADRDPTEADNFFNGRRQTWPFGTSVVPVVRRRQPIVQEAPVVDENRNYGIQQQTSSPEQMTAAAAAAAAAAVAASPISRLIQRYDEAINRDCDVFPARSRPTWPQPSQLSWRMTTATSESSRPDSNNVDQTTSELNENKTYSCHICSYIGDSKLEFDAHMRLHFDHRCPFCDYSSRTEGRLRCHIKTFHSAAAGVAVTSSASTSFDQSAKRKPKVITCQKCGFKAKEKEELWIHRRQQHMSADKVLECPRCPFATELRHHLEYHLRSHYGSRPYKCDKCTYRCYNQSMLNSHAKSHTNVYQFRCADCQFAAKYCHSLKVHLRQNPTHSAAPVLNEDGSVPTDGSGDFDVISRRGRPRGPRLSSRRPLNRPVGRQFQRSVDTDSSLSQHSMSSRDLVPSAPAFAARPAVHLPQQQPTQRFGMDDIGVLAHARPVDNVDSLFQDMKLPCPSFVDVDGSRLSMTEWMSTKQDAMSCRQMSMSSLRETQTKFVEQFAGSELYDDQRQQSWQSQRSSAVALTPFDELMDASASPPLPEPTQALCGDLPLDLTAKARLDAASSPSNCDVTAYRPRRHYETWSRAHGRSASFEPRRASADCCSNKSDSVGDELKPEVISLEPSQSSANNVSPESLRQPEMSVNSPSLKRCRVSESDDDALTIPEVKSGSPTGGELTDVDAGRYQCSHCDIEFNGGRVLHAMHMAFHAPDDPFQCRQCGVRTGDRVQFFLHLARVAHT